MNAGLNRLSILFFPVCVAMSAQTGADVNELVTIEKISVTGSRFQARSVVALTALRIGQKVDDAEVRKACQRMVDSGLIDKIEYTYESLSSRNSVLLRFTIADALPLLPASIRIEGVAEETVWKYLQDIDPLFTREFPRTERAIALYATYIESYLATIGKNYRVLAQVTGEGDNATGIVFTASETPPARPD